MPKITIVFQYALLSLLLLSSQSLRAEINYGEWEMTVQSQSDDMPSHTETFKKCITRDNLTPGDNISQEGCTHKLERVKDTVIWSVQCKNADNLVFNGGGEITYKGNSMKGTGSFTASKDSKTTMEVQIQYTGKRLGDCQ